MTLAVYVSNKEKKRPCLATFTVRFFLLSRESHDKLSNPMTNHAKSHDKSLKVLDTYEFLLI